MPQLIAILLIGFLVFYAVRALRREMARIGNELGKQEKEIATREAPSLEKGPDGVYRPRSRDGSTSN